MAKRASTGSGMVITLVVSILVAVAGVGVSIHMFQQWKLAERAIEANQKAFQEDVVSVFQRAGWDLPRQTRPIYGITYDEDAYRAVAGKLELAVRYGRMHHLLPWQTAEHVEAALNEYSPEGDRFSTADGLMHFYASRYVELNRRVEELNLQNQMFVRQLEDKDAGFTEMQSNLNAQIERVEANYGDRLARISAQYADMEGRWEDIKDRRGASFSLMEGRIRDLERKIVKAERLQAEKAEEVERLKEQLVVEIPEELAPEGRVLAVEREYDVVMIDGGEDAGRRRNDQIVIFRESPDGEPVFIGNAVIARVFETTSMASVVGREAPLLEGQLFVGKRIWERTMYPPEVVVHPVEVPEVTEPPPVVPEPDVTEPDEVEEDIFIF